VTAPDFVANQVYFFLLLQVPLSFSLFLIKVWLLNLTTIIKTISKNPTLTLIQEMILILKQLLPLKQVFYLFWCMCPSNLFSVNIESKGHKEGRNYQEGDAHGKKDGTC
jgi:hypothetical protein